VEQSRERKQAGGRRARGDNHEPSADAARAGIGHTGHPRGGAADELHLAQIENDHLSVSLGCPKRPVGLKRRGDVESAGKGHLEHAKAEVVGRAAKA
jgi:hypothetical protein